MRVILAVGIFVALLVALAATPASVAARSRSKAAASRTSKQKGSKTKKSAKSSARSRKSTKASRSNSARSRRSSGLSKSSPSRRAPVKPPVDVDLDGTADTAGPRPANRTVQDIPSSRVIEIQSALIREGVLAGPANGVYDSATFEAMSAFQQRKGLTQTGMPTAHSLKALGVRKNSGTATVTPSVLVNSTAPSASASERAPMMAEDAPR